MRWLLIGALIVAAALVFGRKTTVAVRVPTDPAEVLEHVASSSSSVRELKSLEAAARASPGDALRAVAAARKAVDLAGREADPRYWGRAQAALQAWRDAPRPPPEVLSLRASISFALHDFDRARADLEQLDDADSKLQLARVERVTGRYPQAREACARLAGQAARLSLALCLAQVDSLTGHAAKARAAIEEALALEPRGPSRARALRVLGEVCERAGDDRAAEAAWREALKLEPDDPEALAALADLLLELSRPDEVEPLLSTRFSDDEALLRLAIAEVRALGRPGPYAQMLRWRYTSSAEREQTPNLRDRARYALEVDRDAASALELAAKNWATQKEPLDTRLLLEASLAAKQPAQARDAARFVLEAKSEEPRLLGAAKRVLSE
jgi:tetratricopeptide (TPR) repeat protein